MVLAELKLHRFYQLVVSTHRILVTILSKLHDLIYFGQRENPPCVLERHRFVFVGVFFLFVVWFNVVVVVVVVMRSSLR